MSKACGDTEEWSDQALLAALIDVGGGSTTPKRKGAEAKAAAARGPEPKAAEARVENASADLARRLLADLGGVGGLARAGIDEIERELSKATRPRGDVRLSARRLAAAFELARRCAGERRPPNVIASSADVAAWAITRLGNLDHEELWLLAVDGRSRLRAIRCVARGGLHGMGVRAADPLRIALRASASGFVLVHNHPSGDPTPSAEDIAFTRRVTAAGAVVGLPLLDHVVVAREGFASVPFERGDSSLSLLSSGAVDA
jgi:DNA repair protein RadC